MKSLAFRCPGIAMPLLELLARACTDSTSAAPELLGPGVLEQVIRGRFTRVDGKPVRNPAREVAPGQRVDVDMAALPDELGLAIAAAPGPAHEGPLLAPRADAPDARVLVPELQWHRGTLDVSWGTLRFACRAVRSGVAELDVTCVVTPAAADARLPLVLSGLAEAGFPVLGDVHHGGILVAGGVRCRQHLAVDDPTSEEGWWPDEPVLQGGDPGGAPAVLEVSQATQRIVERGHPFILRDEDTGDTAGLAPGACVHVRAPDGSRLGLAHVEGTGRLAARMWSAGVERARDAAAVEARVAAALARREPLLAPEADAPGTDAFRLVHGEADGMPGLYIDRLGPLLRVLVTSPGTGAYRDRAIDAIVGALEPQLGSDPAVVEVIHTRDRPAGELECVRLARGQLDAALLHRGRLRVCERGLVFLVDPGTGRPHRPSPGVGLFLDQRDNRARLARHARERGGRWLNLFAHTGAFSVSLLAAGAREVSSVDLSGPYLGWLRDNLEANGLSGERHVSIRHDARRALEQQAQQEPFDGILLDPPTAASAGRRFWSVSRELPGLVEQALGRLAPGGLLFVSRNDRKRRSPRALVDLVTVAASRAGVEIATPEPCLPGCDFPHLKGFPEGEPFAAVTVTRAR